MKPVRYSDLRTLQLETELWARRTFNRSLVESVEERCCRALEETIELCQSLKLPKEKAIALVDYVYSRPPGDPRQEVGGSIITLSTLCSVLNISLIEAWEIELRICFENIEKIRAKNIHKTVRGTEANYDEAR